MLALIGSLTSYPPHPRLCVFCFISVQCLNSAKFWRWLKFISSRNHSCGARSRECNLINEHFAVGEICRMPWDSMSPTQRAFSNYNTKIAVIPVKGNGGDSNGITISYTYIIYMYFKQYCILSYWYMKHQLEISPRGPQNHQKSNTTPIYSGKYSGQNFLLGTKNATIKIFKLIWFYGYGEIAGLF